MSFIKDFVYDGVSDPLSNIWDAFNKFIFCRFFTPNYCQFGSDIASLNYVYFDVSSSSTMAPSRPHWPLCACVYIINVAGVRGLRYMCGGKKSSKTILFRQLFFICARNELERYLVTILCVVAMTGQKDLLAVSVECSSRLPSLPIEQLCICVTGRIWCVPEQRNG